MAKNRFLLFPALCSLFLLCTCERAQETFPALPLAEVKASLAAHKTTRITTRRFKQTDLRPLINTLPPSFKVDTAGRSVEGRPLWRVAWGDGPTEVLLWSQMHGDEPTATAALFDLFSWLEGEGDGLEEVRQTLREDLHLTFLPMLNPDGAQRYQRRNALGIDLNRDALRLTSPEARLLKGERDRLNAAWGFNLHDQSTYYSAGFPAEKGCVASILAPAYDWGKSVNEQRADAMQLIALMNDLWQDEVPGQIGRYNDDFEPRAFGDNLQKWGTRTILIESGGYAGDPEKQEIRRLNLLALIGGLYAIATGGFEAYSLDDYWAIPENQSSGMHDLKVEGATLIRTDGEFLVDIGYRRSERSLPPDYRNYSSRAYISDVGDLHTFGAFETINLPGMRVRAGGTYPEKMDSLSILRLDAKALYAQGFTAVVGDHPMLEHPASDRLRVIAPGGVASTNVAPGSSADLLVYDAEDQLKMVVFDGKVITLE